MTRNLLRWEQVEIKIQSNLTEEELRMEGLAWWEWVVDAKDLRAGQ